MADRLKPQAALPFLWQVAIALGATFLAFVLRVSLDDVLIDNRPYITFYLSVVIAARLGGAWAGMTATVAGGLLGLHFFSSTQPALSSSLSRLDYALYFLIGLVITLAYETQQREQRNARNYALQLEESQSRLQALLDNSPTGIYLKDADGKYLLVNKEYARLLNQRPDRVLGRTDKDLVPTALADRLRRNDLAVLMTGAPINIEKTMTVGGELRSFISTKFPLLDKRGWPVAVGSISLDITDRKLLEEQLIHSQKMDSIGRLAGGIAHDFNNLLTAIIGYAELAELRLGKEHPVSKDVHQIRSAGDRASKLTAQLLAFARKHVQEVETIDLNAVVVHMHELLGRLVGEQIHLVADLEPSPWFVEADTGQIEQVLLNLVVNARDAIGGHGEIVMGTRNVKTEVALKAVDGSLDPGEYALLTVTDNGSGIDEDTLESMFEPFLTTKEKGKGTGLGLATVYGIVRQHGGQIIVDSEIGSGSIFSVYLPRKVLVKKPAVARSNGDGQGRNGTVLVVEADGDLRGTAEQTLSDLGYEVMLAESVKEAVDIAERRAPDIDLLICDRDLSPVTAAQLHEELRAVNKDIRLLLASGNGASDGLRKPYKAAELASAVRKALSG